MGQARKPRKKRVFFRTRDEAMQALKVELAKGRRPIARGKITLPPPDTEFRQPSFKR